MSVLMCVYMYDYTITPLSPGVQDSGSGSSVTEASPLSSPRHSQMVTSTFAIKKSPNGYGMILKAIRVYIGQSDDYRIHHIVEVCAHTLCIRTLYMSREIIGSYDYKNKYV